MLTLLVFVLVFGGMIFVHEFGHYIVCRFFKIPVEEFGFGIPPRVWRVWRGKGHLVIGGQRVMIPSNFDLPFEWQNGMYEQAKASADMVDHKLVLRSIELVRAEKMNKTSQPGLKFEDDLAIKDEYLPVDQQTDEEMSIPEPVQPKPMSQGAIQLFGPLTEIETGTELTINALPLGGFVRPRGENNPDVPGGLAAANPWHRLAVLFAGPLMNLLTAVIIFSIIIAQEGMPIFDQIKIQEVTRNSPAQIAGLREDDIIRSVNGVAVNDMNTVISMIRDNLDKPVQLGIERNGQQMTITATPLSSRSAQEGALGIGLGYPARPATISEIVTGGFTLTAVQSYSVLYIPIGLLQGQISPDEARFVGLKGIYDFFGTAIARDTESRAAIPAAPPAQGGSQPTNGATPPIPTTEPTNYVLLLIGMLSISLGVFNLLPIPALDGGRILFTLPEIIFRRRIPTRLENAVNSLAFLALIGLMLFVNIMDFVNPVNIPLP